MKKMFLVVMLLLIIVPVANAQKVAVKTNLLYGVYTYTPNLGIEIGLGKRSTLDINGGYNPWNLNGSETDNTKRIHWLGNIEYRYWFCEKFNGHFFGTHALVSHYNIGGYELPLLFGNGSKYYRYQGWAYGAGVSYGYQWVLGKHWNAEASIGVGYAYLTYDKYNCAKCGDKVTAEPGHYFGPTKASLSIIYTF